MFFITFSALFGQNSERKVTKIPRPKSFFCGSLKLFCRIFGHLATVGRGRTRRRTSVRSCPGGDQLIETTRKISKISNYYFIYTLRR